MNDLYTKYSKYEALWEKCAIQEREKRNQEDKAKIEAFLLDEEQPVEQRLFVLRFVKSKEEEALRPPGVEEHAR